MQWQYRTILFEFTKDGLLGDKYVDDEEMEKTLNQVGGQGWELINVTLLQDGVLAFLKKPVGQERVIEPAIAVPEPEVAVAPPVLKSRPAPTPKMADFEPVCEPELEPIPEPVFEPEPEPEPIRVAERPRKPAPRADESDFIGGIRIS